MADVKYSEIQDPTIWGNGVAKALKVGDTFTEEWLDNFRSLLTGYNDTRAALARLVQAIEHFSTGQPLSFGQAAHEAMMREYDEALQHAKDTLK